MGTSFKLRNETRKDRESHIYLWDYQMKPETWHTVSDISRLADLYIHIHSLFKQCVALHTFLFPAVQKPFCSFLGRKRPRRAELPRRGRRKGQSPKSRYLRGEKTPSVCHLRNWLSTSWAKNILSEVTWIQKHKRVVLKPGDLALKVSWPHQVIYSFWATSPSVKWNNDNTLRIRSDCIYLKNIFQHLLNLTTCKYGNVWIAGPYVQIHNNCFQLP